MVYPTGPDHCEECPSCSVEYESQIATLTNELSRLQGEMARVRRDLADAKRALAVEWAFIDVQSRLRCLPEGFLPVPGFTDGKEIVIEGDPPDEELDPNCEHHGCDSMGCGMAHVILRVAHPFAGLRAEKLKVEARIQRSQET